MSEEPKKVVGVPIDARTLEKAIRDGFVVGGQKYQAQGLPEKSWICGVEYDPASETVYIIFSEKKDAVVALECQTLSGDVHLG